MAHDTHTRRKRLEAGGGNRVSQTQQPAATLLVDIGFCYIFMSVTCRRVYDDAGVGVPLSASIV